MDRQILIKKKKALSDVGKYRDADIVKHSINKTKEEFIETKNKELNEQHKLEYSNLEEHMMLELEDFNKYWDDKMNDFEQKTNAIEDLINQRHQKETKDLQTEMETYIPKIKPNHEYNQLKMTEVRLKKLDRFLEAEEIKLKCEQIEKRETERLHQEKNDIFKLKACRLEKKHFNEISVARRKLQDEYNIMANQREKEYDKLMIKFKTRKIELDLQQKHEKNMNRDIVVIKQSKPLYKSFFSETANERFSLINNSMNTSKIEFGMMRMGQSFRGSNNS